MAPDLLAKGTAKRGTLVNRKYAVLTPARNEADALPRLAESLAGQTVPPLIWLILENGSSDGTAAVAAALAQQYPFSQTLEVAAPEGPPVRGGPIVKAIHAGLDTLPADLSVVMKVDADVTLPKDYAERLFAELERDPQLGIVSGSCHGTWCGVPLEHGVGNASRMCCRSRKDSAGTP